MLTVLGIVSAGAAQAQELPLGSALPAEGVELRGLDGAVVPLAQIGGSAGTVFVFWSNQCPWVDKYEGRLQALVEAYAGRGIQFVLVNSNDATAYPQEGAEASRQRLAAFGGDVLYVVDAGSRFARALGAERTPHVYFFGADDMLTYVGTIDDSPGDPANVSKEYLRGALERGIGGGAPDVAKTKAFGCTIKYYDPAG